MNAKQLKLKTASSGLFPFQKNNEKQKGKTSESSMLETEQIQVERLLFSTRKGCPMNHLQLTKKKKNKKFFFSLYLNFVLVCGNADIQYQAQVWVENTKWHCDCQFLQTNAKW